MKKPLLLAAALAVSAAPAVHAAEGDAAPAAKPAPMSPADQANIQRAALILRTFNLAFESKDVQQPVKGQLLSCLYNNKLSAISTATKQVLDKNPTLKADDAGVLYRVAAGVCGIQFKRVDGAAEGATAVPKPAASKPATGDSR